MAKRTHRQRGEKLARLPSNATISKRPLLRPGFPSARLSGQKVIYISTKTPFMSAVKRCDKLLRLGEQRQVQSARTTAAKPDGPRSRKRPRGVEDEVQDIAELVEEQRAKRQKLRSDQTGEQDTAGDEEVLLKGSGKAIAKVMGLALWFQQRDDTYAVKLRTATAASIDDVQYEQDEAMEVDGDGVGDSAKQQTTAGGLDTAAKAEDLTSKSGQHDKVVVEETRIRRLPVLEAWIGLL